MGSHAVFTDNNKRKNEKKRRFFACIAASAYHVTSKEVENCIMDTITILDTHVCANNPY